MSTNSLAPISYGLIMIFVLLAGSAHSTDQNSICRETLTRALNLALVDSPDKSTLIGQLLDDDGENVQILHNRTTGQIVFLVRAQSPIAKLVRTSIDRDTTIHEVPPSSSLERRRGQANSRQALYQLSGTIITATLGALCVDPWVGVAVLGIAGCLKVMELVTVPPDWRIQADSLMETQEHVDNALQHIAEEGLAETGPTLVISPTRFASLASQARWFISYAPDFIIGVER